MAFLLFHLEADSHGAREREAHTTDSYLSVTMCAVHKSIGKEMVYRIPYIYDTCRPKFPYFKGILLLSHFSLYKIINFVWLIGYKIINFVL